MRDRELLSPRRVAAYCADRGLSSPHFERTVLEHALRTVDLRGVAGRSKPPLELRLRSLVSERARAELVYWHRLRDYVTWRVASRL